ncbi:uncharacterized protein LOC111050629 [Nilaparvata lugens]|uniref:uncharacterized protein LOC111050629 n=1 Tax=Nilaparvata lugens TaxID=108931 RepID=UPI00193D53AF|nr:uncharacterized protein LOC111050629 [Nilaparvata lugens]
MVVAMTHVVDVKPRVISAEVKRRNVLDVTSVGHCWEPRIAGELDLVGETTSEPHYVEVRDGNLLLYPGVDAMAAPVWRLPLRRLNLQPAASGRLRAFCLSRRGDQAPLATFQVGSDYEYERWVKILVVELMRQTPLDAVRFLDILGITATLPSLSPSSSPLPLRRTHSADSVHLDSSRRQVWAAASPCTSIKEEDVADQKHSQYIECNNNNDTSRNLWWTDQCKKNVSCDESMRTVEDQRSVDETDSCESPQPRLSPPLPDVVRDLPPCERRSRARTRAASLRGPANPRGASAEPLSWAGQEAVARLMARCQQADHYVPVKDKKLLFESLCRKRLVCSSDNIDTFSAPCGVPLGVQPRAHSLHDLSRCHSALPVKQLCRYFERDFGSKARQTSSAADHRLPKAKQLLQNCQETVLSRFQRSRSDETQASIEHRLADEENFRDRSSEETEKRQLQLNNLAVNRFGVTSMATPKRHHSDVR